MITITNTKLITNALTINLLKISKFQYSIQYFSTNSCILYPGGKPKKDSVLDEDILSRNTGSTSTKVTSSEESHISDLVRTYGPKPTESTIPEEEPYNQENSVNDMEIIRDHTRRIRHKNNDYDVNSIQGTSEETSSEEVSSNEGEEASSDEAESVGADNESVSDGDSDISMPDADGASSDKYNASVNSNGSDSHALLDRVYGNDPNGEGMTNYFNDAQSRLDFADSKLHKANQNLLDNGYIDQETFNKQKENIEKATADKQKALDDRANLQFRDNDGIVLEDSTDPNAMANRPRAPSEANDSFNGNNSPVQESLSDSAEGSVYEEEKSSPKALNDEDNVAGGDKVTNTEQSSAENASDAGASSEAEKQDIIDRIFDLFD